MSFNIKTNAKSFLTPVKRGLTLQLLKQVILVETYLMLKHKQHMCTEASKNEMSKEQIEDIVNGLKEKFKGDECWEGVDVDVVVASVSDLTNINANAIHEMLTCNREMRRWGLEPSKIDGIYTNLLSVAKKDDNGAISTLLSQLLNVIKITEHFLLHLTSSNKELTASLYKEYLSVVRKNPFLPNDNIELLTRRAFVLLSKLLCSYFDEVDKDEKTKDKNVLMRIFIHEFIGS